MVSKNKNYKKIKITVEKYALILLFVFYIAGIFLGSAIIFNNIDNALLISIVKKNNILTTFIFFTAALILKYSGVLSVVICALPLFSGIYNSAYYCIYLLNNNKVEYSFILTVLKDTAIELLLILYLTIIIFQIINKKYVLSKDLKYFTAYLYGAAFITTVEYIIINFIF